MTSNRDTWLKRVADLLRLADHPTTSKEEAATAAAKAASLMMKFNIERAEAERINAAKGQKVGEAYRRDTLGKMDSRWNADLAHAVAKATFCSTVLTESSDPTRPLITLIGQDSNITVVKYLYTHLLREIRRLGRESYRQAYDWGQNYNDDGKRITAGAWERAFGLGAAVAVRNRLRAQREQDERDQEGSTALIVLKGGEIEAALDDFFPNRKRITPTPRAESQAWSEGYHAGRKVSMNPGLARPRK